MIVSSAITNTLGYRVAYSLPQDGIPKKVECTEINHNGKIEIEAMGNWNIVEATKALFDGTIGIEQFLEKYNMEIRSMEKGQNRNEVLSLVGVYFQYGKNLAENGYCKDSLSYIDDALSVLGKGINLISKEDYKEIYEAILNLKSTILLRLERYMGALKYLKELKQQYPTKDEYNIHYHNCYQAMINKSTSPLYVFIILYWAVYVIDHWLLNTDFLPSWTFNMCWHMWLVLIVIQFGWTWIVNVTDK
ncbi:hypothetical protein AB9N12_18050 [Bacteroides sp. AN502(2024)]|uniref:hypothetical protein n=1 Tax=Bacteroides sp. AN502(2024) TaxID=3160599 RepID=UPI003512CFFA